MKNQELQSALVKSGIILVLFIFFIYAFAVGDSGGVTGAIASIFSGILFLVGLTLALAVSVLVLFGIYFGILYMYNQDTCKETYEEFRVKLTSASQTLCGSCSTSCSSTKEKIVPLEDEDLAPLRQNQEKLGNLLSGLQESVTSLEKTLSTVSSSISSTADEISRLGEKAAETDEALETKATTTSVDEAAKKLGGEITSLQTSLSSLDTGEDTTSQDLQDKMDSALSGIQEELASMKESIEGLAGQPQKQDSDEEDGAHRILSYFTKKADEKKFVELVNEAVSQEMTYAQAGEFLNDSLSAAAAEVIADHPSLTKDYIRTCRQKD